MAVSLKEQEEFLGGLEKATLPELLNALTSDGLPSPVFVTHFLLTYRAFTTALEILAYIRQRLDSADVEGPARLRLANFVRIWLTTHFDDFDEDEVLDAAKGCVTAMTAHAALQKLAESLNQIVSRKQKHKIFPWEAGLPVGPKPVVEVIPNPSASSTTWVPNRRSSGTSKKGLIQPLKTSSSSSSSSFEHPLLQFDPSDVAKQLTLTDLDLFRQVKANELLKCAWMKANRANTAPHVIAVIDRFNQICRWVSTEILSVKEKKHRLALVKRFIQIADACRKNNNFSSSMAISASFHSIALHRLGDIQDLGEKERKLLEQLRDLFDNSSSSKNLRAALRTIQPPAVPYLGMYLTDLAMIEEAISDPGGGLINFRKWSRVGAHIAEMLAWVPYAVNGEPFTEFLDYMASVKLADEDQLYELSLKILPKSGSGTLSPGAGRGLVESPAEEKPQKERGVSFAPSDLDAKKLEALLQEPELRKALKSIFLEELKKEVVTLVNSQVPAAVATAKLRREKGEEKEKKEKDKRRGRTHSPDGPELSSSPTASSPLRGMGSPSRQRAASPPPVVYSANAPAAAASASTAPSLSTSQPAPTAALAVTLSKTETVPALSNYGSSPTASASPPTSATSAAAAPAIDLDTLLWQTFEARKVTRSVGWDVFGQYSTIPVDVIVANGYTHVIEAAMTMTKSKVIKLFRVYEACVAQSTDPTAKYVPLAVCASIAPDAEALLQEQGGALLHDPCLVMSVGND